MLTKDEAASLLQYIETYRATCAGYMMLWTLDDSADSTKMAEMAYKDAKVRLLEKIDSLRIDEV